MKPPFRRNLLSSSVEMICRYWRFPSIVEDYRIGESIKRAQAMVEVLK